MKLKPLMLLAAGAAAYYFVKTDKGRAQLKQFTNRGNELLHRSDVQENISKVADQARQKTAGTGGVSEHGTRFVADKVQEKLDETPTHDA